MKQFTKLTALLAVGAMAPAIATPSLVSSARAQAAAPATVPTDPAFQDVKPGHWAYDALQKLAAAGVLEGYPPTGNYIGQRPMTRYEFAVAIARLLDRIQVPVSAGTSYNDTELRNRITTLEGRPLPDVTRAQVQELIDALKREFQDDIARIDGKVTALDQRMSAVEARVPATNRLTTAVSILHRRGFANYIDDSGGVNGRTFLRPDLYNVGLLNAVGVTTFGGFNGNFNQNGAPADNNTGGVPAGTLYPTAGNVRRSDNRTVRRTFSYTDLEVRLQDRVSDRLSVSAALRSLGSTQEDPWAGDSGGGLYVREAFATANVGDRVGLTNIQATLGRQRTRIAQGLLYDNDLSPTDQLRYDSNLGPVAITAFFGSQNNSSLGTGFGFNGRIASAADPYGSQGSEFFLNPTTFDGGAVDLRNRRLIGFGTATNTFADDSEGLLRGGINLFRISGQPVQVAYSRLLDGFRNQGADSVDVTLPLFNRSLGIEAVRNIRYEDGSSPANGDHSKYAGVVTLNALRTSILDLNVAYGRAGRTFEFLGASAANPYARSYGEAIFDRPLALGAPLINPAGGNVGEPQFLTAKEALDFSGTVRIPVSFLRRVPLDFRYYTARSGRVDTAAAGGFSTGKRNLGNVYSVGTRFPLTPGVDLEVKGGVYSPKGGNKNINYVRVGASVGF